MSKMLKLKPRHLLYLGALVSYLQAIVFAKISRLLFHGGPEDGDDLEHDN
jgi:hypothetical protein